MENPMGFEKALPNTAESAQQEKFMEENFKLSNGYLRPVPFDDVEYLPVTGSHMAAALNIVADGPGRVRGLNEELSTDGYIDHQKAMSLCPSWKKPLTDGMPCIVFRRELETACPELPAFLSRAGNQSHDVHSKETTNQLMLLLSQMYHASYKAAVTAESARAPTWQDAVREMVLIKPYFQEKASEAAAFCAAWSGGDESPNLVEVEAFAKTLKVRREPEYGQLEMLAKANMKRQPRWPTACYKALLQAPDKFCRRKGEAAMFTNADIMPNVEETAESAPEDPIRKAAKSD